MAKEEKVSAEQVIRDIRRETRLRVQCLSDSENL